MKVLMCIILFVGFIFVGCVVWDSRHQLFGGAKQEKKHRTYSSHSRRFAVCDDSPSARRRSRKKQNEDKNEGCI